VSEGEVTAERELYRRSDEVQSKPEQARDKIVEGMLAKRFFAAYPGGVLADQPWIHDPSKTVAEALAEDGLEVVEFTRYALAE
jgi:translation elongation factor EF-Ts